MTAQPGDQSELVALVKTLRETQDRIRELTGGAVDAVIDATGESYLLPDAQRQLRDSERQQRRAAAERAAILDALPAFVAVVDTTGRVTAVNGAWRDVETARLLVGGVCDIGTDVLAACANETGERRAVADEVASGLHRVLQGATAHLVTEYRVGLSTGDRWFRLTVAPLSASGQAGAVITQVDVTQRRQAEESLRRATDLLGLAGRLARVGGWSVDLVTGSIEWSDEVCAIHDEPPGTRPAIDRAWNYYPPEWRAPLQAKFDACAADGTPLDEEVEILSATGTRRWVRVLGEGVRDDQGKVCRIEGALQDVSDRKQIEHDLVASHLRFRQFADALPQIVWTAGSDGNVDFANAAFFTYVGVPAMNLPGREWLAAVHTDDVPRCIEVWTQSATTGAPYALEFRLRRADGEYRWHFVSAVGVRGQTGEIIKWYGTALDVHDRRATAERVRESEARFRAIARATADVIWDWNLVTDEVWWNDGLLTTFGYAPGDVESDSRSWTRLIHPDDAARVLETIHAVIDRRDEFWECEYRCIHRDGTVLFVEDRGYLILDSEGAPVRFVGGVSDITERQQTRQRIAEQARLLDEASDAIMVRSVDGRITYWNRSASRIYGWTAEEALGRSAVDLLYDDPAHYQRALTHLIEHGAWQGRAEKRRKDGKRLMVEANWTLVRDADGEPSSILVISSDITQRLELEAQLRQSQRLDAVGQLTGGVAHDFNNLLTVILGSADELVDELSDDQRLRMLADMTRAAAMRGAELTHRLLAFSRRQPLEPRVVKVNQLLAGMDGLLRRTLPEHIEIELVQGGGLWDTLVDPAQLESAILNLCLNARDAMPGGGVLTIDTGNAHLDHDYASQHAEVVPGQYVTVAVTDTGQGMTPEVLSRAFDPFFTTKEQGKGTGLGLSMVYGFVKQSSGHVKIYSEPGHGTTVKLYLPRSISGAAVVDDVMAAAAVESGTETILLVEDDASVRRLAVNQLQALGYVVLPAANASDALATLRSGTHVDLLFTDVIMPGGLNGRQLADAARALRPGIRVLYTSGYTENAIVHQGRLDPGVVLLSKPYRRTDLARYVRQVLGTKQP